MYFSSTELILEAFDIENDPSHVVIRMNNSSVMDFSALQVLSDIKSAYAKMDKTVHIRHLKKECENKVHLLKEKLDWNETEYDHHEIDVPKLVQFADELATLPGVLLNRELNARSSRERSEPNSSVEVV